MRSTTPDSKGFTLLEMMLSIAVFIVLITSAFSVVNATTEMITELSEAQNRATLKRNFMQTCEVAFDSMDLNSDLEFVRFDMTSESANTYLAWINTPGAFDVAIESASENPVRVLASEIQSDGFIRCGIYFLEEEDWLDFKQKKPLPPDTPYVELLPRAQRLTWRFRRPEDRDSKEWQNALTREEKSSLVELIFDLGEGGDPVRKVFKHLEQE